jgi:periplasmic protein TonB
MDMIIKKKINNPNLMLGISSSILCHLLIAGGIIYGNFHSNTQLNNEGRDAIKAVMIDLSQIAAPKLSMSEYVDSSAEIPSKNDDKQSELAIQPETVPQEITPTPQHSLPPKITKRQAVKLKPEKVTPHKKSRKSAKSAQRSIRQDVVADNIAEKVVASKVAGGTHYSSTPSAISRRHPDYPRRARDMKIEGHVVVVYDIDQKGHVVNIRIIEAKPSNIFNQSVRRAMGLWKYEPKPAKDLKITIVFNRDKSVRFDKT